MVPMSELLLFAGAALLVVLTPGPNMIYLISRSICQGCKAGAIALVRAIAAPLVGGALLAEKATDDVESGALHPS